MAVPPTDRDVCADPAEVAAGPGLLAAALDASAEATALLDAQGRCVYVNPAGVRRPRDTGRRPARAAVPVRRRDARTTTGDAPRRPPLGRLRARARERDLEHHGRPVTTADGRRLRSSTFRDVTDVRVQRRRFTAFATAAANIADAGSLRGTLDAICAELVETTDLAGAQIFLIDETGTRMRVHGAAPVDRWPSDFALRLEEARRRGAGSLVRGVADRPPRGHHGRKAQMLADPRWAPLHDQLDSFAWEDFAAVPLGRARPARRGTQRLLRTRARARRRRDRVPHGDGRPGRGRGGERPAGRRSPGRGGVRTSATGWRASSTTPHASGCSR